MSKSNGNKSLAKFITRLGGAIFIVLATFNPTGYSYIHWIINTGSERLVLKLAVGLALFMVYYALFSITLAAFRRTGLIVGLLASLLFATEIVVLITPRSLRHTVSGSLLIGEYVLLLSLAVVIAFGVSWSSFIERLTGQQQKRYVAGPPTPPAR